MEKDLWIEIQKPLMSAPTATANVRAIPTGKTYNKSLTACSVALIILLNSDDLWLISVETKKKKI